MNNFSITSGHFKPVHEINVSLNKYYPKTEKNKQTRDGFTFSQIKIKKNRKSIYNDCAVHLDELEPTDDNIINKILHFFDGNA